MRRNPFAHQAGVADNGYEFTFTVDERRKDEVSRHSG
jgi:hypothetical protein